MPTQEIHTSTRLSRALSPVSGAGDNTAQVSQIVDTLGFEALEFAILTGTLSDADATFAVTMDHGDAANLSDAAAVASTDLLGTLPAVSFTFADDDVVKKIGYVGSKRYVRLTITPSANTGAWLVAVLAILGAPARA